MRRMAARPMSPLLLVLRRQQQTGTMQLTGARHREQKVSCYGSTDAV